MGNYKKVVLVMMFIILLLVALTIVAYYRDVEIVTNISLSFIIACTTGVVIEVIHGAKERDSRNIIELKKELEEMRYKIINFRRNLNKLSRNRNRYNFYNNADRLMEEASRLNEEINYIYENKTKKSLIKKFLYNQEINLEHKITSVEEIREDIVNMVDKRSILKKISRYNHKLDKLLYSINRELGMK